MSAKHCTTHHHACDCREAKFEALREALRWTIESIDITDWSRDGIEMLDSARQLYLDTREGGDE